MSDHVPLSEVDRVVGRNHREGQAAEHVTVSIRAPLHVLQAEAAERERLEIQRATRIRAQTAGWPGPYTVQVLVRTVQMIACDPSWEDVRTFSQSSEWRDASNTHDRRFTAEARARALVHGLPDGERPSWYGDRRRALGAAAAARVVDWHGRIVLEVTR